MQDIEIEKGIPIPAARGLSFPKIAFQNMEINDSVHIEAPSHHSISARLASFKKSHPGWNFTVRRSVDGGFRIWRIS